MYSILAQLAAANGKPFMGVWGSATLTFTVFDITLGVAATPADDQYHYDLLRYTDAGTGGTALTEVVLGSAGPASGGSAKKGTYSADPTEESAVSLQPCIFNHRAGCRIPLDPRYPIRSKAASANGIGLECINQGGGGTVTGQIKYASP